MAVYTSVTFEQTSDWLKSTFDLGELTHLEGISGGIENTNYFLDIKKNGVISQYVLTLFERLNHQQLPYYLNLMDFLSSKDISVPTPFRNKNGEILQELAGKPAVIVSKLAGSSKLNPTSNHCAQVGEMLAKMHLVGEKYPAFQENLRSLSWWNTTVSEILPFIDEDKKNLLQTELEAQNVFFSSKTYQSLPSGACHCDLFRDNVLFKEDKQLSGFFDFYFAGTDKWLFDVAVTVNDWCIDLKTGVFDPDRLQEFISAYQSIRPFTSEENASWNMMLRAAALRFWISRLWDFYIPRDAQLLTPHDPYHFEKILRLRIHNDAN